MPSRKQRNAHPSINNSPLSYHLDLPVLDDLIDIHGTSSRVSGDQLEADSIPTTPPLIPVTPNVVALEIQEEEEKEDIAITYEAGHVRSPILAR